MEARDPAAPAPRARAVRSHLGATAVLAARRSVLASSRGATTGRVDGCAGPGDQAATLGDARAYALGVEPRRAAAIRLNGHASRQWGFFEDASEPAVITRFRYQPPDYARLDLRSHRRVAEPRRRHCVSCCDHASAACKCRTEPPGAEVPRRRRTARHEPGPGRATCTAPDRIASRRHWLASVRATSRIAPHRRIRHTII